MRSTVSGESVGGQQTHSVSTAPTVRDHRAGVILPVHRQDDVDDGLPGGWASDPLSLLKTRQREYRYAGI